MDSNKRDLRKRFRDSRNRHRPSLEWKHLTDSPEFKDAKIIASYVSYDLEPDTTILNAEILKSGKTLLLPRMNNDRSLSWIPWDGREELLARTNNHQEPRGNIFEGVIDLYIVPALAVDKHGYRLGQGGGSYDRALAGATGWKIALINENELLAEPLPVESHDQPVNAVATPSRLVRF